MSNENNWIDFNLIRESISMEMLIIHFGLIVVSRKSDEVRLKCPFHNGKSDNSMAINLAKNGFYCFGCKVRGDVLEFVAKYENCSLPEAALLLDEWFSVTSERNREAGRKLSEPTENVPPITPAHLIASIEHQLAQLKKLILSS
jgi:DNA primase